VTDAAEIVTRRAPLASTTWNPEARTLEVVFSTGAGVVRHDARGAYEERLDLEQDWSAFIGAPVLNSHRRGDLGDVLGSVIQAWTVGAEARAVIRLSRRPDLDPIIQDILDGHIRGTSVGYTVETWKETVESGRRVKIATRWTPVELSLVPLPADRHATIRKDMSMPDTPATAVEPGTTTPATAPATTTPAATIERAAVNAEIRAIARVANLDQTWTDAQVDAGATAEAARAAAFETMRTRNAPSTIRNVIAEVGTDYLDPEVRARTIGEALYTRATPGHTPSEAARPYVTMTSLDIARDSLRVRGISTTALSPSATIERALHSTSDFPLILGDAVGRTLRASYQAVPSALKRVARQSNARDFKARHRLQLSAGARLLPVPESGEIKSGTIEEAKESYKLATFARMFGITRQALVNDDLGAFTDLSRRLGQAAAATEAALLVDLLEEGAGLGPLMNDGRRLFHADHGNLAAAGATPWGEGTPPAFEPLISAGRLAMRRQVDTSGELVAVTPKFIIVPSAGETACEKALAGFTPTRAEDVNPFSALSLVVEPRLSSDVRWYIAADPAEVDGLEWSYLEGAEGPQVDTKAGFEIDGVQIRVRLDFGAGFVDHRSWYCNPGEAE